MRRFAQKFLILALASSFLTSVSYGASIDGINSCQNYSYSESKDMDRQELLEELKSDVMADLKESNDNLEAFYNNLRSCHSPTCIEFSRNFNARLRSQLKLAKYAQAIATRGPGLFGYMRAPRTAKEFIRRKHRGDSFHGVLVLNHILNFDLPGFTFSEEEKKETFELWWKTFIPMAHERGPSANIRDVYIETQKFFEAMVNDLMHLNPMLGYITDEDLKNPEDVAEVLGKIVGFNKEFIDIVDGYKTYHKTGLISYVNNVFVTDHEMGLVNFRQQADNLLAQTNTDEDRHIMCSAWADLKSQQTWRINVSIGVGFATAVACGVGSLSGVGTLGAIAWCGPAFVDSIIGASRGYYDARTGFLSQFAGRTIDHSGNFTDSILSLQDGSVMQNKSTGVFLVNTLALIPAFKVVAHARHLDKLRAAGVEVAKPRIRDYLLMPAADASVSVTEKASYYVAYALIATKGLEFFREEFPLMVKNILDSPEWP